MKTHYLRVNVGTFWHCCTHVLLDVCMQCYIFFGSLETFIPNAFAKKGHAMSIYFDLEKAYDTTWKYGILKSYLSTFISNRKLDYGCIIYVNLISSCLIQLIIKDYDSHLEHSYLEFFYLYQTWIRVVWFYKDTYS